MAAASARLIPPGLAAAETETARAAVRDAALARFGAFLDGLDAYRGHGYRRPPEPAPVAWQAGGARLLDYGGSGSAESGITALLIPSLVNRYYVLDLLPGRSLAAYLAGHGIRTLVLDWGDLAGAETAFGIGDFVTARLEPALAAARALAPQQPVAPVGYCMGGNLALALALRRQADIAGLAVLATPWDFHAHRPDQAKALAGFAAAMLPGFRARGAMPLDVLQGFFAGLDPLLAYRKFRRFAALDPQSPEAIHFVALEDWLNDGVDLPWRVADECFRLWYGDNDPGCNRWTVAGTVIRPADFARPALAVIPAADRIVPPEGARPLAAALPRATTVTASAGHIGMMVGSKAERELWRPLRDWLRALAAGPA